MYEGFTNRSLILGIGLAIVSRSYPFLQNIMENSKAPSLGQIVCETHDPRVCDPMKETCEQFISCNRTNGMVNACYATYSNDTRGLLVCFWLIAVSFSADRLTLLGQVERLLVGSRRRA